MQRDDNDILSILKTLVTGNNQNDTTLWGYYLTAAQNNF